MSVMLFTRKESYFLSDLAGGITLISSPLILLAIP